MNIKDITSWLFSNCLQFLNFILSFLPDIPSMPENIKTSLDTFFNLIFSYGSTLLCLFIRPTTIVIVVPLLIIVINFDKIYSLVMWVLKKIPFLNMK